MMKHKFTPFIAHAAAWLFFFSLVLGFVQNASGNKAIVEGISSPAFIGFCLLYLLLFYINTHLLIPKLYLKKKFVVYAVTITLLFTGVFFIKPFDKLMSEFRQEGVTQRMPVPPPGRDVPPFTPGNQPPAFNQTPPGPPPNQRPDRQHTDIVSIILFFTVWSLGTATCIIKEWRNTEQRVLRAEADKANAELSFLKAQINPHFLFNTLNNIYSLAVTKSDNTADSIMKLSNIMRYITDDVREDFVSLDNEIECMRDYVDLQKLRLGKKTTVQFTVEGELMNKKIAPLILMSFIENVFKYGVSNHEPGEIIIKIRTADKAIHFYSQNRLFDHNRTRERTGIGISNTRQRLQHLYPDSHSLDIATENGFFTVQLVLRS